MSKQVPDFVEFIKKGDIKFKYGLLWYFVHSGKVEKDDIVTHSEKEIHDKLYYDFQYERITGFKKSYMNVLCDNLCLLQSKQHRQELCKKYTIDGKIDEIDLLSNLLYNQLNKYTSDYCDKEVGSKTNYYIYRLIRDATGKVLKLFHDVSFMGVPASDSQIGEAYIRSNN